MATLRQELRSIQTRRPIFSYQDSSFLVTFLLIQGQMKKLDRAQIIYALVWKRKKSETVQFKDPISSSGPFRRNYGTDAHQQVGCVRNERNLAGAITLGVNLN